VSEAFSNTREDPTLRRERGPLSMPLPCSASTCRSRLFISLRLVA
jgi:hypothetical protein